MKPIGSLILVALLGVAVWYAGPGFRATQQQAFAQEINARPGTEGSYLLSYYDVSTAFDKSEGGYGGPGHSGGAGDALVHIVNAGNFEGEPEGGLFAVIAVFNDVQEMQECCVCPLTPNSMLTISVIADLTSNPLITAESTEAGVIKILGFSSFIDHLAEGLHAWISHTESMASNHASFTPPFGFVTSTSVEEFADSKIDDGEGNSLRDQCEFIFAHGSGHGICTCGFGD